MSRFWEPRLQTWQVQVLPGDLYVTRNEEVISTVLGSCVSACVRDAVRGIGGMNHFLLPRAPSGDDGASARYGLYALELLLNSILEGGGKRGALEVKVFGGGRVLDGQGDIGRGNIEFVRKFFADERLPVAVEDVAGNVARKLRYWPLTGRVQCMHMVMSSRVASQDAEAAARLVSDPGSIELF